MFFRTRFFLSLLGQTVPLTIAFLFVIFAPEDRFKTIAYLAGISVLGLAQFVAVFRPLKDLEDIRQKQFEFFFKQFVDSAKYNGSAAHIRVNVMFKRWSLRGPRLFQYYQYGMAGYPDDNLNFSTKSGVCGHVLGNHTNEVVYKTKAELESKDLGLSKKQRALVTHLTAIASIPLFREVKTFLGYRRYKYYGVLNVDSIDNAGAQLLAEPAIHEQIRALASFVQITVG